MRLPQLTSSIRILGGRGVVLIAVVLAVLVVSPIASAQKTCPPTEFELAVTLRLVGSAQVGSDVKVVAENPRLIRELRNCSVQTRPLPAFDWVLAARPAGSTATLVKNGTEATLRLDAPGRFTVRFLACPQTCTIAPGTVVQPQGADMTIEPGSADLWVMGLEINQGVHDEVFRTLGTTPLVVLRNGPRRPLITSKPAVVRVFVGVRNHANYPVQAAMATGRLVVSNGGVTREFLPVSDAAGARCQLRRSDDGAKVQADPCLSTIAVRPTVGRSGLPAGTTTASFNDLDLVSRRTTWSGTLNYVVPASLLYEASRVVFRASVVPVGVGERFSGDNTMVLDHKRIARGPEAIVRPVLVSFRDPATGTLIPAPSIVAANHALGQIPRLAPLIRLRNGRFPWRRMTYTGETITVLGRRLDQCETLWWRLYRRYGLNRHRPLIAFLSEDVVVSCGGRNRAGLGFKVPHIPFLLEGGGIAWAKIPTNPDVTDIDRFVPLAHELYHALDARHVSNDHGEASGCASMNKVLKFVLDVFFDTTCWQNGDGPHGTIGVYPRRTVGPGPLQTYDGAKGAIGVDLLALGTGPQLTLYDPCPTRLVTVDPQAATLMRFQATCPVSDENRAHDLMSYGPNSWASPRQFFHRIGLPLMPPP